MNYLAVSARALALFLVAAQGRGAELPKYYGHPAVLDQYGVIAPWYHGLNGQCDYRVRIAAETLKRYPWTTTNNAIAAYPHYVFSGSWRIDGKGAITPANPGDWGNGDLGQRATSVLNGLVNYYCYSGDPAAVAHLTYMADFLIDHALTPPSHPWPGLFISVPVKGIAYSNCNPHGMIQLDICASAGQGLLRAYQLTGNRRYFDVAKNWGDLLALHCNFNPGEAPWPRYANPEDVSWSKMENGNKQTGGVSFILGFLDDLIRLVPPAEAGSLANARDAGRRYLADTLLPAWTLDPTWGYYFWDWRADVETCIPAPAAAGYLIAHPRDFPNWRNDARNILTLFFNRTSVSPASDSDVYSGAWAYPESSQCCGRSLWYAPLCVAPALAAWAARSGDAWPRELVCRQLILQTYDAHETGVTEDNIDGGVVVNGDWFNIAHPLALRCLLEAMGWLPDELGPSRENHIMRSSGVVTSVRYGRGHIQYSTFDAPPETSEVLRLAFVPTLVMGDGRKLKKETDPDRNGFTVRKLSNGDAIVVIRHDGLTNISVEGKDPQQEVALDFLAFRGTWTTQKGSPISGSVLRVAEKKDAGMTAHFFGNQVRLIGRAAPAGGLADVYIDDIKQLAPIDSWNPRPRIGQVLYYRNGLALGVHSLRVVLRGEHNPYSVGDEVGISAVQFSAAQGNDNFPTGRGPVATQRMIFGYTDREDYRDSEGHFWRPATEFVSRLGNMKDSVTLSWWTNRSTATVAGTSDSELYQHGVHCHDFWVNVTVGPGEYHARLKFAACRGAVTPTNDFGISINGRTIAQSFNVTAAAGGPNRAVDVLCNHVVPLHGIIQVHLTGLTSPGSTQSNLDAYLQALEVGPGEEPVTASPKTISF